ncbi:hypothetical protein Halhy_5937 [Haliscomenobacter hydrossis DSM 1100]|uniref:Uncharacterized protein n=1 Tax=Haliscomenobacter hydrossis (strain ATCC 27775 / DSM 1100 / LMG 10767 / O) TaxID=760192 RepID=F4L087_HALH1|nr:hypothetical protein Halhy_5937 [Haliscomenobacter hydrossis DSM 1100]
MQNPSSPLFRRKPDEILARITTLRSQLARTSTVTAFNAKDPALKIYKNNLSIRIEELSWVLGIIPPFNNQQYDA